MSGNVELLLDYRLYFIYVLVFFALIRISYLLLSRDPKNNCLWPSNKKQSTRTMIVMGSGIIK